MSFWRPISFGSPVTPLASQAASTAPGYAVPGFGAARLPLRATADWLRGFVRCCPLRYRPHSATAPFANKKAKGLRLRAGLCRARRHQRRMLRALRNRLSVIVGLGILRFRLCRAAGWLGCRPALRVPARRYSFPPTIGYGFGCFRCGLPSQLRWSATQHNAGIMRSAKNALSAAPHNFALCVSCLRFVDTPARPPVRPKGLPWAVRRVY